MIAQAQECIFKSLLLPASATPDICPDQLQLAQEAAQVRSGSSAQKPQQAGQAVATQRAKSRAQGGQAQSWVRAGSGKDGRPQTRHLH